MDRRRLIAKISNRLRHMAARAPYGELTGLVQTDLFRAHQSLYGFLTAFSPGRRVLLHDQAFAAPFALDRGASHVTAVLGSDPAVRFATRTWGSPAVEFATASSGSFDLVIGSGETGDLRVLTESCHGILLLHVPPHALSTPEWAARETVLRSSFRTVRRFVHRAHSPLDLGSPFPSALSARDFSFEERSDSSVPSDALTIIYMATDEERWDASAFRLHLGCGPVSLDGWVNVDNQPYGGVDVVWDLSLGLPFSGARYIFAEHFLEHLSLDQGSSFLERCRAALEDAGTLRLSTPNLDWVWTVSYHPRRAGTPATEEADRQSVWECIITNRAFRGWGHQFLYNAQMLEAALERAGFATVRFERYGQSSDPVLQNIEHHEPYPDAPDLPHVLVVEASGRTEPVRPYEEMIDEYRRDISVV